MQFYWISLLFCFLNCTGNNKKNSEKLIISKQIIQDSTTLQPKDDSLTNYIYLSFDDGPLAGTKNCVDICLQNNIKATFFIVAKHSLASKNSTGMYHFIKNKYPQLLVANHSFSHANGKYKQYYTQKNTAFKDIMLAQDTIHFPYRIVRLPGNNAWVLKDIKKSFSLVRNTINKLDSAKMNVIGWDLEWDFTRKGCKPVQSATTMVNFIDSGLFKNETIVPKHLVLLMHDNMFRTPKDSITLVNFIQKLKSTPHYKFETLDKYPILKY